MSDDRGRPDEPLPELLSGVAAFAARAAERVAHAGMEVAVLSQELDRRVYGGEAFAAAIRRFVLQHERTRVRVLVNATQVAMANSPRFVELGRSLSSFVEFRELLPSRRQTIREEYLIADGRALLYRETPQDLDARDYGQIPHAAREKLREFDLLWNESPPAQELRKLGL